MQRLFSRPTKSARPAPRCSRWVVTLLVGTVCFGIPWRARGQVGQPAPESTPESVRSQAESPDVADAETKEAIRQAIARLSDDRFQVRQAAMDELWRIGPPARQALEKAAAQGDPETAARARSVLSRFGYGLFADTDPVLARWINTFRFGGLEEKRAALEHFRDQGMISHLIRLISVEPNQKMRTVLARSIVGEIHEYVKRLPLSGAEDTWEQLLKFGATDDQGMRHYAAFLAVTGRMEDRLPELQADLSGNTRTETARLIAWILRADGQWDAAIEIAAKHNQTEMVKELAYESRRWGLLAQALQAPQAPALDPQNDIESMGVLAVAQRLQGDEESLSRTMDLIDRWNMGRKSYAFYVGEAMLINGYYNHGVARIAEYRNDYGFRLLVRRGEFRRAFEFVGMSDFRNGFSREQRDAWFETNVNKAFANNSDREQVFSLVVYAIRALHAVGFREEARARLEALLPRVRQDKARLARMSELADTAIRYFGRDEGRRYAAAAIVGGRADTALGVLFSGDTETAGLAYRFLSLREDAGSKEEQLKQLDALLRPTPEQTMDSAALADLESRWLKAVPDQNLDTQVAWRLAFSKIAELHDHGDVAVRLLTEFSDQSSAAAIRAAELEMANKKYAEAEALLNRANDIKPNDAPTLYLRGWVRKQLDHPDAAEDIAAARLLPLAVVSERRRLAQALQRNGLTDEAIAEYERIRASGDFQEWHVNDAAKQIGNLISGSQQRTAAEHWERLLFSGLKRSSYFTAVEGYLQLKQLIHKTKARDFLSQGEVFAATKELQEAYDAIPDDISLAEDFVPLLEELDATGEADLLFERTYKVNSRIVEDFPDSAMHLNNLAWLSARCGRRLETALAQAQKANALRPETASYIDTLGEVYFRLGRQEEAIECAQRCLALDPENDFYQKQLQRFQAKPEAP